MYLEQLSTLLDFIKEIDKTIKGPDGHLFTILDLHIIGNNEELVNYMINVACNKNKRIHSEKISQAIEEVSSKWEVSL